MAACILDALSCFFIRTWRKDLNAAAASDERFTQLAKRAPRGSAALAKYPRLSASFGATPRPELIALAALSIAKAFLDDTRGECRWWAGWVAQGDVDAAELDVTVKCMLRDLEYDLMSFTPEIIEDMRTEIFGTASAGFTPDCSKNCSDQGYVAAYGLVTPAPSPIKFEWVSEYHF